MPPASMPVVLPLWLALMASCCSTGSSMYWRISAIDSDDRELVVAALLRLPRRVGEQLGGVELLDGHLAEIAQGEIHDCLVLSEHDPEKACPGLDPGWYRFSEKIMLHD